MYWISSNVFLPKLKQIKYLVPKKYTPNLIITVLFWAVFCLPWRVLHSPHMSTYFDKEIFDAIEGETNRQATELELIASENYVSKAVREANGSIFTNKYSEGYSGKRYYAGQEFTDVVETIAIERAKKLFGADHANVQPHSGAPANIAAFFAWLEPGDTILGMDLGHGGHLTHGHPVTHMSKIFRFVRYGVKDIETGEIDYDELREVALREKPKMILAGFSCYTREYDYAKIKAIADEVGAVTMADMAHIAGLIAGKALKNPFDYGFNIITTTTHKTLRGPRGGLILSKGIVSNPFKAPEKTVENLPTLIDRSVFPGFQGGPHMHTIAAKAICFGEALTPAFAEYAEQVLKNAKAMEAVFHREKIRMIYGGTSNHILFLDVFESFQVGGKEAQTVLESVGMSANMNATPNDPRKPTDPSGLRIGTPAMTTRGFKEADCARVAELLIETLKNKDDEHAKKVIKEEVRAMAEQFPIPEHFV
jgi:glycine hydroxymethyltransferase